MAQTSPERPQKTKPVRQAQEKVRIPRNVNFYLHFLQHQEITENDIEWVLQLRHLDQVSMLQA